MPNTTNALERAARLHPFLFAFVCWAVVAIMLVLSSLFVSPTVASLVVPVLTFLFAVIVLARLGWLRAAGFRRAEHWRDLLALWPAVILTIITLIPVVLLLPRITSISLAAFAVLVALLAGLNEEAMFRGLLLQVLRPYGLLTSAALSAVFFALVHANNFFHLSPVIVIPQLIYAFFFGFAYAAFRLRTKVIWPLMLMHGCSDIGVNLSGYATAAKSFSGGNSTNQLVIATVLLLMLTLALAIYSFFMLRAQERSVPDESQQKVIASQPAS